MLHLSSLVALVAGRGEIEIAKSQELTAHRPPQQRAATQRRRGMIGDARAAAAGSLVLGERLQLHASSRKFSMLLFNVNVTMMSKILLFTK